jgi:phosphoserine phosphatase RsbU/P
MGWAMLAGVAVWFVNWTFTDDGGELLGSEWLKTLFDFLSLVALVPLTYFAVRGAQWVMGNLLWRLRRRLIVTYLLIGALPVSLVVLLAALVGWTLVVQFNSNLVARQLDGYLEQSREVAESIARDLSGPDADELRDASRLSRDLQERANALAAVFPRISIAVTAEGKTPVSLVVQARRAQLNGAAMSQPGRAGEPSSPPAPPLPAWLGDRREFHGLVVEEYDNGERQVYARHVVKAERPVPLVLQLSYPVSRELSEHLSHTTGLSVTPGQVLVSLSRGPSGEPGIRLPEPTGGGAPGGAAVPERAEQGWGYPIFAPVTDWRTGEQAERDTLALDASFLWPRQILSRLREVRSEGGFGQLMVMAIAALGSFFMLITLVAAMSAAVLTRSITGAVHNLYQGTRRVEAGDLEHEIPTVGRDQLAALTVSFNQMMRSVRELLRVSAEKRQLDQEMRIAAEVQARLFPRETPPTARLDIAPGVCIPARAVSGDYYDFFEVAPGVIGVVVADVCGKGVSAALLMSNLQANLRGQVQAYHDFYRRAQSAIAATAAPLAAADGGEAGRVMQEVSEEVMERQNLVRQIVGRVNRQIEASITDSRYVTLFYAEFDERGGTLRYTNAGHNPPLLLRAAGAGRYAVERLDRGGPVLGLFSDAEYEEGEVAFGAGDLLVAFTDGLIEAHNAAGEEFGEERLCEILKSSAHLKPEEIETRVLQAVKSWTAGAEQEDDLTLVILKGK